MYLCEVEWIEGVLLGLFGGHDLEVHSPRRMLSILNGVVQIPDTVIGIGAGQTSSTVDRQILNSLIGLKYGKGSRRSQVSAGNANFKSNCQLMKINQFYFYFIFFVK